MEVLVPAEISISHDIQNVGIINRSLPQDNKKFANILEGLFTGESIYGDREGSLNCMHGLANTLNTSPRFKALIIDGLDLRGTGTRQFPPALEWSQVEKICSDFRVDGLIALETFDSNIGLSQGEYEVEKKVDGQKVKVKEYEAKLNIDVNSGWRIYDPIHKSIADMNIYSFNRRWDKTGKSPDEAMSQLPPKRDAINQTGIYAGEQYGFRISPTWAHVTRNYYSKGQEDLELAKRYVKTDEWDKAIEVWQKLVNNPDHELAGKAAYNMALASEMKGELDIAQEWAKKSYEQYGNKKALGYLKIIEKRIRDQEALKKQMGE
jgi:tetratricopeptide (TPR) repeat protein